MLCVPRWYLRVKGSSPLLGVTIFSHEKNSNPLRVNKGRGYFRANLDSINMINIIRSKSSPPTHGAQEQNPREKAKEAITRTYYIKTDCRLGPWAVYVPHLQRCHLAYARERKSIQHCMTLSWWIPWEIVLSVFALGRNFRLHISHILQVSLRS